MVWREQYDRMLRGLDRVERHYRGFVEFDEFGPEHVADFRDDIVHAFQDVFHLRDWLKEGSPQAHLTPVSSPLWTWGAVLHLG